MAVRQRVSLLVFGVLFVATSLSGAAALDADLAGRKLLFENYGSPHADPPILSNLPLQVSTEKLCGKEPCPRPPPAPVKMCGKAPCPSQPSPAFPPCPEGLCDQALADDQDFGSTHIDQVDYPQPGPSPTPDIHDYPPPAAWSLHECDIEKCPNPMQVCFMGRCDYPPHVKSVIKALADDRDFGATHIDQVDYPQPGPSPTPDIHDYPPPAAWSLHDVACVAICSNPMQVCLNGRCVDPPHFDSVNRGFNRGGAVLP